MEKFKNQCTSQNQLQGMSQNKFKPIKMQYNQLQSKYDIYKNGSPNIYEQQVDALKLHHIKNDLSVMQLPAIDYILKEIKNAPKQISANKRDFIIHPTMGHKYANKFKDATSDKQEVKDFMDWFKAKDRQITVKNISLDKKFHLIQSLIASGFNQILNQIGIISRPRCEILKMLWNRQTAEAQNIINLVHRESTDNQKNNLEIIRSLHIDYQQQIIHLKTENYCMEKKLQEVTLLNEACINTLRVMRKQKKKYEIIMKQLKDANLNLKEESLNLVEQNTKLLIKDKSISAQHARILTYRIMQGQNYRKKLKNGPKIKEVIKNIKNKAEQSVQDYDLPDIEDRKQKLVSFIKNRMKDNPNEKLLILKGEFEDEQDQIVALQTKIEEFFNIKSIQNEVSSKSVAKRHEYFIEKGINTEKQTKKEEKKSFVQIYTQTDPDPHGHIDNLFHINQNQEHENIKKIQQSYERRNSSLFFIQMNKAKEFKKQNNVAKIRRASKYNNITSIQNTPKNRQGNPNQRYSLPRMEQLNYQNKKYSQKLHFQPTSKYAEKIAQNHKSSFLVHKSTEFQNIIQQLQNKIQKEQRNLESQKRIEQSKQIKGHVYSPQQRKTVPPNFYTQMSQKNHVEEFRILVRNFIKQNQHKAKTNNKNPEKHLKKILTNTYKAIYVSGKYNFLGELIKVAKNCYGNIAYEDRLLQLLSLLLHTREQNSLLSAVALMIRIQGYEGDYKLVTNEELSEIYFKIYFNLSLTNSNQNKFNIWNNYTNLNKLNSQAFTNILQQYYSENKCTYLNLKIKQFIGVDVNDKIDGSYYVQINSLMMYLLEVYLIEKKNYFESYHEIIDFIAVDDQITLESFIFLLDLLCFNEEEQRKLIIDFFDLRTNKVQDSLKDPKEKLVKDDKQNLQVNETNKKILTCNKDCFYRICVKYELPLYQFLQILKNDQFKALPQQIKLKFSEFDGKIMWKQIKKELECMLSMKKSAKNILQEQYFVKLLDKLDVCVMEDQLVSKDVFTFMYRLIVQTAFS